MLHCSATLQLQTSAPSTQASSPSPTFIVCLLLSCASNVWHELTRDHTDYNVTGTSSGAEGSVVVDLECSATCDGITATGTHLTAGGNSMTAEYVCKNIATQDQVCLQLLLLPPRLYDMHMYALTLRDYDAAAGLQLYRAQFVRVCVRRLAPFPL